uniref:Glycosyltransferase family 92 protein n=1 Tax=Chrysotila carterae TaxID=13221 RepID=A0A7S4C407_CHRCT
MSFVDRLRELRLDAGVFRRATDRGANESAPSAFIRPRPIESRSSKEQSVGRRQSSNEFSGRRFFSSAAGSPVSRPAVSSPKKVYPTANNSSWTTEAKEPAGERQVIKVGTGVRPDDPPSSLCPKPRSPKLKVGITLMTRKPHRFDWWLRYHRNLGICHVFVHVEDTPELLPLLDSDEFAGFVTVTTGDDNSLDTHNPNSPDNYYTLMQRQEEQVRRSVVSARRMGIQWLFHIDDDELLHLTEPFSRLVRELGSDVTCITFVNIEATPKSLNAECVFEEIDTFSQHLMLAYRNGKSAGRVSVADWHGPHRFTGRYCVVPVERACILHFESCTYEQWRNKFIKHKEMGEAKKNDIPFPFYRDSVTLFQEDPSGGKNEQRWKAFYQERKIEHFEQLHEDEKIRIRLTSCPKQMIDGASGSFCKWRNA